MEITLNPDNIKLGFSDEGPGEYIHAEELKSKVAVCIVLTPELKASLTEQLCRELCREVGVDS